MNTRSESFIFNWDQNCFFCEQLIDKKRARNWSCVGNKNFGTTIQNDCDRRLLVDPDDQWALSITGRLSSAINLVASGAKYHQSCRASFSKMRQMKSPSKIGGPQDSEKSTAFEQACIWLENEMEMKTIGDFCTKMRELSPKGETYKHQYVKSLLQAKYGS